MADQQITIDEVRQLLEDISSREFRSKPMGYDPREVDEYLDTINDSIQRILDYMDDVRTQLQQAAMTKPAAPAAPAPTPVPAPAPVAAPTIVSAAVPAAKTASSQMSDVEEVLTAAVMLKNSIISEAQAKAEAILSEAEEKAATRLGTLSEEQVKLEEQVAALKKTAADYRAGFEQLLQAQQSALDAAADLFD